MQTRLPISKPLALVVIGLIIGLSLGLGSGYAVFYPDMVNERSKTVEERLGDIEDSVAALDSKISAVNESIGVIDDSLNGILALADIVDQISSRVSSLENGQITLNNDLNGFEDELTGLGNELSMVEDEFVLLEDSWTDVTNQFSDLETAYYAVNQELADIQGLVRENDGVNILTGYMANPPSVFEQKIAVELYKVMIVDEPSFKTWSDLYGESTAKLLLQQEIDAITGSLVWNPTENIPVGDDSYQVKLQTFFTLDFKPASLTIRNIHLEIKATVNIDSGAVNGLQVSSIEIM